MVKKLEILIKKSIIRIKNNKRIIIYNILLGMLKGIGFGIGVTIITAIIVFILQRIVALNIPIIGDYISDIVDIVMKSKYR